MDDQSLDSRMLPMHVKLKEMPTALNWKDIACFYIFLDFISAIGIICYLQHHVVETFVDILVDIFDCLHRHTDLHINVAIKLHRQLRIIRNNTLIVENWTPAVGEGVVS
jgi:hypothetical protein